MNLKISGLDTRSRTKEEYMYRRSQDRIRTYYYRTREELSKQQVPGTQLHELLLELKIRLQRVEYYGCYFDRSKYEQQADLNCLCDPNGMFMCQGKVIHSS